MKTLSWAATAGALVLATAAPVFAQGQPCVPLCAVACVKPISIPDRWDDTTPIAGYAGELPKKNPNWRNNAVYDSEPFVDANGNGLWDPGEFFTDGNQNGIYDRELYDPATTGYNPGPTALAPAGDLGLELVLGASQTASPAPGQYFSIAFPPSNRGTPLVNDGGAYRDNWAACAPTIVGAGDACVPEPGSYVGPTNQAMRDLIAQDPDAYWDPITGSVQGSRFALSPRVIYLPIHDPRIPLTSANNSIRVTKIAAFFMETMEGNAVVRGRFLRASGIGESCTGGGDGFVVECPTPAPRATWGQVKARYR